MGDQPGPELRQHNEVEALGPSTPDPGSISNRYVGGPRRRPAIGEVLRELQHGDHRQLPRRDPWSAPDPERVDERLVSEDLAQFVTHPAWPASASGTPLWPPPRSAPEPPQAHADVSTITTHLARDAAASPNHQQSS